MGLAFELLVILGLTIGNGLFSGAEIAVLSVRKTRLRELADEGNKSARALLEMRAQPEQFLATVQIGITVIGATAGAFGGQKLARALTPVLEAAGISAAFTEDLALVVVIALISFLSLVLGELVPKSLALRSAERYGLVVARPLLGIAWLARPLVWFLTASSNLVLRIFRDRTTFTEARLSKEELQQLVDEAGQVGALDRETSRIAYRALDFGDVRVGALMVPRADMVTLSQDATPERAREVLTTYGHERVPIHAPSSEDMVGYVTSRDLLAFVISPAEKPLASFVRPALFVPETNRAVDVLGEMQKKRDHLALLIDETGFVIGLVTLEDLLEEIVGEIFAEHETPVQRIVRERSGAVLIRARVAVHEANRELGIDLPEGEGWTTVGGLVTSLAGGIPKAGVRVRAGNLVLEVVEATERRVLAVRILPERRS